MTSVDLEFEQLNSTVDALRRSISNRLMYGVGKDAVTAQPRDWLHAVELAVRDRLSSRMTDDDLMRSYSSFLPDEPGEDTGAPIVGWIAGNTFGHYADHRAWIEAMVNE